MARRSPNCRLPLAAARKVPIEHFLDDDTELSSRVRMPGASARQPREQGSGPRITQGARADCADH